MAAVLLIAVVAAAGAAAYAYVFFGRYMTARREHERVLSLFSRYVPPPVVEELLARKDPRLFEARQYYATILCVRIRNFALFSESLTPEETLRYLNEFYTIVGQAAQRHRGMIESLRGDTVYVVFGVLLDEKFQEERSLRAALDIMRMVKAMESRWQGQGRKPFAIGVGVNSGKIVAGDTGFQNRREFAIVGNPTHVARQLEEVSEDLNASIIASQSTYATVSDLFVSVPTSSIPLRGLRRLQNAYIIRGLTKRSNDEELLTLPSQRAFRQTVVREYQAPESTAVEPDAYLPPKEAQETVRVDQASAPATIVDERLPALSSAPFERSRFSQFDEDVAAFPEPPPLLGTYEDDQGPPIQLPP